MNTNITQTPVLPPTISNEDYKKQANSLFKLLKDELGQHVTPIARTFMGMPSFIRRPILSKALSIIEGLTENKKFLALLVNRAKKVQEITKIDYREVVLAQYLYDILQNGAGFLVEDDSEIFLPTACTVGVARRDNKTVFVRAMDWAVPDVISDYAIFHHLSDGAIGVGFPGFIGTVTSYNQSLLFAMNQAPSRKFCQGGLPTCFFAELFRKEVFGSFTPGSDLSSRVKDAMEAFEEMRAYPMSACMLFFASEEQAVVMEFDGDRRTRITKDLQDGESFALSNHFLSGEEEMDYNEEEDQATYEWMQDTHGRKRQMEESLISSPDVVGEIDTYSYVGGGSRKKEAQDVRSRWDLIWNSITATITAGHLGSEYVSILDNVGNDIPYFPTVIK